MNSIKLLCALGLSLTALSLVGCNDGSDENRDGKNSGNPEALAYVASCERLCDAQAAKACSGAIVVADCKTLCAIERPVTGDCATKYKAYGACTDTVADVCTASTTCASALDAAKTSCGPP